MELLFDFNAGVLSPNDPHYRSVEYRSWLNQIEMHLSAIRKELQQDTSLHDLNTQSESVAVKELFLLATLLYLERKSKRLFGPSTKTDKLTDDAYLILSKIDRCNKPFPLFIFGSEAQTDDRRRLILDIIDQSTKETNTGRLVVLREVLPKLWVQDDLNAGGNLDYEKSSCRFLTICSLVPLCLL